MVSPPNKNIVIYYYYFILLIDLSGTMQEKKHCNRLCVFLAYGVSSQGSFATPATTKKGIIITISIVCVCVYIKIITYLH